jgi:hypothetical protein
MLSSHKILKWMARIRCRYAPKVGHDKLSDGENAQHFCTREISRRKHLWRDRGANSALLWPSRLTFLQSSPDEYLAVFCLVRCGK